LQEIDSSAIIRKYPERGVLTAGSTANNTGFA
jgi:hypothetical protein